MTRKQNDIVDKVRKSLIQWNEYPSIPETQSVRKKAYLLLGILEKEMDVMALSASEIGEILSLKFRRKISRQAVRGALIPMIGTDVESKERKSGVVEYSLLRNQKKLLGFDAITRDVAFIAKDIVIPPELFTHSKGYIKKVVNQINGCYRNDWCDASATMIRRLFETLIIEKYEEKKLEDSLKDTNGDYYKLHKLISILINDNRIKLSSSTKTYLSKVKLFGDTGAHARRINIRQHDIKKYTDEIRLCAEELASEL